MLLFCILGLLLMVDVSAETSLSTFRIVAPQYVCPKSEDDVLEKSDNTIITVLTSVGSNFRAQWTVRWKHLLSPTQRFTLMLWRTVRALERKLNGPQPEPLVYVIENSELLSGVDYIFNVSEIERNGNVGTPKSFNIDNTHGNQELMIEGRGDMISVNLVGSQVAYVDVDFILEADVTKCYKTQDYYFIWKVVSEQGEFIDVSQINGSRLEIPPNSLKAGLNYDAVCQLLSYSDGHIITEVGLPFRVSSRNLEAFLSVDHLVVTANQPFFIEGTVLNHDNIDSLTMTWQCIHEDGDDCDYFEEIGSDKIYFSSGLHNVGKFVVCLAVSGVNDTITKNATITSVESVLPVIQVTPIKRTLNEGTIVSVTANVSNISPNCTFNWYFASEDYLSSNDSDKHGEALTETLTIHSLEENFLNELADYTNETEWRQVTADLNSAAGRARFVAQCGCSLTYECDRVGIVYADMFFSLNVRPVTSDLMITPDTGSALETVFRISTLQATDANGLVLRYAFYCKVGSEDNLLLASFVDYRSFETVLPYVDGGTEVWVEVCEVRGACSSTMHKTVMISHGEGRTITSLIQDMDAHGRRCEMIALRRVVVSALVTYYNIDETDLLKRFLNSLQDTLSRIDQQCIMENYDVYTSLLDSVKTK